MATGEINRRQSVRDSLTILVALGGLYWFTASFFLAKRTLKLVSSCHESESLFVDVLGLSADHVSRLQDRGVLSRPSEARRQGCWMPRRVESVAVVVVDALRFDFCLYNLPRSVGTRLPPSSTDPSNQTRLFRFVADPPTITMQRLKALTTGGLPTFADISANFGGAALEEDSWVHQLMRFTYDDFAARGRNETTKSAFVGDDTWTDLFPGLFTESFPFPSFNTRDLDTVDNGCMQHLNLASRDDLEVVVMHFLGVDHVGHTYGPHNQHMDSKLQQIDAALAELLDRIDASSKCEAIFIFGDHGMTEDGNHGGGTEEEVSAAIFVHTSPACPDMTEAVSLERDSSLLWGASQTFASIHQIDIVPTLSMMLGLPIPFGNLGSLVPSLVPGYGHLEVATALALNAGQVWRYLDVYSATANTLPNLQRVKVHLDTGMSAYKRLIEELDRTELDADKCNQVSGLLKLFLAEALALGQRVWTRFDHVGMTGGIIVMMAALISYTSPLIQGRESLRRRHRLDDKSEIALACATVIFLCCVLTFSNSYIYEEEATIMFFLSILSVAIALRMHKDASTVALWQGVLMLPLASRMNGLLVSGHGLDPSLQAHWAHSPFVFVPSIFVLGVIRLYMVRHRITESVWHGAADCSALFFLMVSWWEKYAAHYGGGLLHCRIALVLLAAGLPSSSYEALTTRGSAESTAVVTAWVKVVLGVVAVTGPAGAPSLALFTLQAVVVFLLSELSGSTRIHSFVLAALWKLVTRHVFFATNHGCAFNRLQYSAAFVATTEFYFTAGGLSLFLNTFGWEMIGLAFIDQMSKRNGRVSLWRIYTAFQLLEVMSNCVSVSLLRRHLMVWDVFAPKFLFTAIFTALNGLFQLSNTALTYL